MKLNIIKIEKELKRLVWTKTLLANQIGVSKQSLNYYLRNPTRLTLKTITRIANALSIDPKDLIT